MSRKPSLKHPPESSFAFRINVLGSLISRPFHAAHGKAENLTLPEWRVLQVLDAHPDQSYGELGDRTGLHKMQVSRAVERALRLGRVECLSDPEDGRRKIVRLTDDGRALCQRSYPGTLAREQALVAPLSAEQRRQLDALLTVLTEHMRGLGD